MSRSCLHRALWQRRDQLYVQRTGTPRRPMGRTSREPRENGVITWMSIGMGIPTLAEPSIVKFPRMVMTVGQLFAVQRSTLTRYSDRIRSDGQTFQLDWIGTGSAIFPWQTQARPFLDKQWSTALLFDRSSPRTLPSSTHGGSQMHWPTTARPSARKYKRGIDTDRMSWRVEKENDLKEHQLAMSSDHR